MTNGIIEESKQRRKRSITSPNIFPIEQIKEEEEEEEEQILLPVGRAKSSTPYLHRKGKRKRTASTDSKFPKIRNPFTSRKKTRLDDEPEEPSSSSPITTGSGVLIPKLNISLSNDSVPSSDTLNHSIISSSSNFDPIPVKKNSNLPYTSSPLRLSTYSSDDEDHLECELPDDEDYDADNGGGDTPRIEELKQGNNETTSPNSTQSPTSSHGKALDAIAAHVLVIRQRLLDKVYR